MVAVMAGLKEANLSPRRIGFFSFRKHFFWGTGLKVSL